MMNTPQAKQAADFLAQINITELIRGLDIAGFAKTPNPCPDCGEYTIYINGPHTYECVGCDYWGNGAQYMIEREGFTPSDAVEEMARRSGYPVPNLE